jgi:hypothetical protein
VNTALQQPYRWKTQYILVTPYNYDFLDNETS